ncbi:hypothetical protein E2C01_055761 [Portunus trituberculatus]|uniref:Uncharacterized protein n=1 Tax=Portunus trituberculatus TaxID=210409 RepID=A0A5B7GVL8_PORTR|nr:hypothetical protein [Portunus trituberculatus]
MCFSGREAARSKGLPRPHPPRPAPLRLLGPGLPQIWKFSTYLGGHKNKSRAPLLRTAADTHSRKGRVCFKSSSVMCRQTIDIFKHLAGNGCIHISEAKRTLSNMYTPTPPPPLLCSSSFSSFSLPPPLSLSFSPSFPFSSSSSFIGARGRGDHDKRSGSRTYLTQYPIVPSLSPTLHPSLSVLPVLAVRCSKASFHSPRSNKTTPSSPEGRRH